jgi:hypothetical protein
MMQVSGSLYGALIGSALAFTIADFLGLAPPPSPALCYIIFYSALLSGLLILFMLIGFHRATQRAYPCIYFIFDWSPPNCSSTQLPYHGGWPLFIWHRNWTGSGTKYSTSYHS